jgi:2-polyprenyl-3-methyl-5-hydroxy-6-metoxy-1,4-benzoquinol methylase
MDRNELTFSTYNRSAKNYEDKVMGMDLYNDTYDLLCEMIEKKNADILELASGPGNVTKHLLSQRPDFKITGTDIAPNMIELAKINNPKADFQIMDCRDIENLGKTYDAIVCGFCMPYLSREECAKLIKDASKLLNAKGMLYFSTMEDDYDKSGFETTSFSGQNQVYIYYHQADHLTNCLTENGFQIIDLIRKDCPEPDGSFLRDMIFLARKE